MLVTILENKQLMRYFILFFSLFFVNASQASCPAPLVSKVENYLNSFKNFSSDFEQIDKNNRVSEGSFEMKRPGYMKLEYDRPNIEIIYNNGKISYLDKELGTQKNQKIHNFILRAILDGKLENRNLKCNSISQSSKEILVSLNAQYDVLNSSNLILHFEKHGDKLSLSSMENRQKGDNVVIHFFNVEMN
jgi:outer membrane lipoprotein-sorting protein